MFASFITNAGKKILFTSFALAWWTADCGVDFPSVSRLLRVGKAGWSSR